MTTGELTNTSVIGRLLEEVSWDGQNVRAYRDGGRGRENVLTAEVFSPLSYLPREQFLGEVLRSVHGAEAAFAAAADEVETADLTLLPDEWLLPGSGVVVQPDALITTPDHLVLVEAKRIRSSSFQPEQLAREYVSVVNESAGRVPLMLLVLGAPPPIAVKGLGRLDPVDAVASQLDTVLGRTTGFTEDAESLLRRLPDVLGWITWSEIDEAVRSQRASIDALPAGVRGTVNRLADAVSTAVAWHV